MAAQLNETVTGIAGVVRAMSGLAIESSPTFLR